MVTANNILVVFFQAFLGPSSVLLCVWKCGVILSNKKRNKMPSQKPTKAGIKDHFPILEDCSIEGIIKLHIEAATITPAAKPIKAR